MHSPHVSKSSSTTAASTSTATTVTTSGVSQPESAAGQRQQGSFVGLLTTPHTPAESTKISSTCHQQVELGLLSEISTTQIAPFEVPVLHTKPSLSTITIKNNLPAFYQFLMNHHDLKNHHSRSMMLLSPSWGKSRVLIRPISGLWWVAIKRGHSNVVIKAAPKNILKKHICKHTLSHTLATQN